MPVLQTQRLTLRQFELEDVDALATILSDAETMRYYPAPFDRAGVADWIQRNRTRYANDGYGLWAMILNATRELIGDCGLVRKASTESMKSRSATTCAATFGARDMPPRPPAPAETTDLQLSKSTG